VENRIFATITLELFSLWDDSIIFTDEKAQALMIRMDTISQSTFADQFLTTLSEKTLQS
jgi:hypothetical protein